MRRAFASLALIFALIGQPAKLEAHVIGKDDRTYLNDEEETRFSAIGKVFCRDPSDPNLKHWTTGTLVGDQTTVFTSGHFGVRPQSRKRGAHIFPLEHCEFRIYAPDGGKFSDGYAYKRFAIAGATRAQPPDSYVDYKADRADWAIITLSGSGVGASLARPINVRTASLDQLVAEPEAFLIAYHDGIERIDPDQRVRSPDCAIRRDSRSSDDSWFLLSCDTNKGSSGGLIFARDASDELVALGFATADRLAKSRDRNNYGQPFTPDVLALIPSAAIPFTPKPQDLSVARII